MRLSSREIRLWKIEVKKILVMACISDHTVSSYTNYTTNITICYCRSPFYGDSCESAYPYWIPLSIINQSLGSIIMFIICIWNIIKIIHVRLVDKLKYNLATGSLWVSFFSALVIFGYSVYPSHDSTFN